VPSWRCAQTHEEVTVRVSLCQLPTQPGAKAAGIRRRASVEVRDVFAIVVVRQGEADDRCDQG
jgi:hypothetical protein